MLMNKARAMIPPISNTQKLLMIVEIMFIALRLSLFLMQVIESINPVKTETIFIPAHTERTPVCQCNMEQNWDKGHKWKNAYN